MISFGRNI